MSLHLIAQKPADLTIKWAQHVIGQHCAETTAIKVSILNVDPGTTTRVRLAIEHTNPRGLPQHWFVKLPPMAWRAKAITALPRLLPTEVRFYNEVAKTIPLKRVASLAAHSRFGLGSTLVLHDVTEFGATPGKTMDALTATQARLVVEQLAHFHAQFWGKADNNPQYSWLNGSVRRLEDTLGTVLAVPLMRRGLMLAGNLIPNSLHAPALRYAQKRKQAMQFLAQGEKTLIHHDCHPGNLFWHHAQPGFLDWQMVRIGEGIGDMAYFLATALTPETRRQHEAQLLNAYCQILTDSGVVGLTLTQVIARYRAHLAYPFEAMLVTLAIGDMMPLDSNLELIRRATAAVEDFDVFEALPI
jgi:hypothetical protein